jgi:hypothetical protein
MGFVLLGVITLKQAKEDVMTKKSSQNWKIIMF